MKCAAILVPYEAVPSAIVDPRYIFKAVNMFLSKALKPAAFEVQLAGLS